MMLVEVYVEDSCDRKGAVMGSLEDGDAKDLGAG